ncbi:MAG TPA: alpha/beta family hydrolase [Mycobacteriales bacterium]|nr:alpha/beta family hydrolase [Mycobacteriales bacterium]
MVLLHGAGTDTSAAPLPRLAEFLTAAGMAAVRFDQPYATVGGRRPPDRAPILDATLLAALPDLRPYATRNAPLAFVGRSSGARVACRTARAAGAVAVVCLGFPLVPPRSARGAVRPDRAGELQEAARAVPVLVLQGDRDPFGMPTPSPGLRIEAYPGVGHTPTAAMAARAAEWLQSLLVG